MSDMFFDNVFTDMAFHQKIQAAASRLAQRRRELHAIVASFSAHLQALHDDSRKAETDLNKTRRDLEKVRREILLGYIAGQQVEQLEEGPPEYVPPPRYYGNPFADGLASREA
jgi:septal ring factor EnvC (AmiA/AmiB activator)